RRQDLGAHGVVRRRQERAREPEAAGDARGDRGERLAARERLGAHEVQADVAVAEQEPAVAAGPLDGVERVPRLVRAPPAARLLGEPAERVEDRVEVRRDVQAEDLGVVRHVRYNDNVARIDYSHESPQEPRAADATREHRDCRHARTETTAAMPENAELAER